MFRCSSVIALAVGFVSLALVAPLQAQSSDRVPRIGLDGPELDACSSIGKVFNLYETGRPYLSVRSIPGNGSREKARLYPGVLVWMCESDGDWQGIVFASGNYQDLGDCRLGTPVAQPQAYDGPCLHGWVPGRYIDFVAG
ncbi:MAG TPA: hypothetical protein VLA37_01185, partial [Sphingomonadaceae bacterium]|nr:hypothetical protein [Sphingomonadaceae bacterium]